MKKIFILLFTLFSLNHIQAQITAGGNPISQKHILSQDIASVSLEKVSDDWKANAILETEKNGSVEKVSKNITTNFSLTNSGTWEKLHNGDKVWRLKITAQDAIGVNPYFNDFYIPNGAKLFIYNENQSQILGAYTEKNNHSSKVFATEIIFGNTMILEYYEPAAVRNQGSFTIDNVGSFFKDVGLGSEVNEINESDPCQINVNCSPVGNDWQDEKRGVARILVTSPSGSGWCTGSLVNNTAYDCKNYFLTAFHCGDNSTTANFNQYIFYFNYEFSGCTNGSSAPSNSLTGAALISEANALASGSTSSDFMLLELNSAIPASYNVYYNGWNAATAAPTSGGVGIHHPAGDVKKISTYTATPSSVGVSWAGSGYSIISGTTHWSFAWSSNSNGHGVTEGGSSGSPMFNIAGEIVGTLSGGGSYCSALNSSDQYGKMSYHWQSNATANNKRLKPWLDPTNSGVTSIAGTYPPCAPISSDDAGIVTINAPVGNLCTNTFIPQVDLRNYGTTTLTSVTIRYQVDAGTLFSFNWTGSLAPNTTTTVNLNNTTTTAGAHTFTAYTQNPNGNTDGNSGNDSSNESFTVNATLALPLVEDFEGTSFPASGFSLGNGDGSITWEQSTTVGFGAGTKSMFIDNWDYNAPNQLDWFVTPTYDFSTVSGAELTYDLAYAYYDQTSGTNVGYDSLGIAVSTDCGNSFYWLWKSGGVPLATAGGLGVEFVPTNSDWTNNNLDLSTLDNETSVQFAFIAINGYGNNLYIDNINIDNAVSNIPVADFTANNISICPGSSIGFTDQSTNTPTSWSWSFAGATPSTSSQENPTVTYNNAGTYTVTLIATNADGSDSETKLNYVTVNSNPTLSFTQTDASCFGGNDGTATAIPSGNGGFTYNWTGSTNTSNTITNLTPGTYTCTVTDANMCTVSGSTSVGQPNSALNVTTSVTNASCGNANGSVTPNTTGGVGPYSYSYSNGGNGTNLLPGAYTVTSTDAAGCSETTSFNISNVNTSLNLSLSPNNVTCYNGSDGSISATATGSSGYTYAWTGSTSTSPTLNNLSAGSYTCTVTDGSGCSTSSTVTITEASEIVLNLTPTTAYCNNANGLVIASTSGGVGPYTYSFSSGSAINLNPGNYTCTVTDASNCSVTETFVIGNIDETFVVNVSTTPTSCTGNTGSAIATGNGSISGYTYLWDNGEMTSSASNLSFGMHSVTLTNANGCSITQNFNIINANAPSVSLTTEDVNCPGFLTGSATATISGGSPGYNVVWSSSSNSSNTENNLAAGTYTITVTDASNCSSLTSFTITEPPVLTVSFSSEDEHCDSKDGQIVATASGGSPSYTYSWDNGTNGNIIINESAGTYTVTVTDQNACSVQATESILNIPAANISNVNIQNVSCANENNGSISLDITGGNGTISTNWSNGDITEDINNLSGGSYTLTISDEENCQVDTTIIVAEPNPISISLSVVDNSPASTSTITANASGGSQIYTYAWNTGQNTQTITNLPIGAYTVTVVDDQNCDADTTVNIGNVSIQNTDWIDYINLYPNPTNDLLNIELAFKNNEDVNLKIVNAIGQELYQKQLNEVAKDFIQINTSEYSKGIYFLQIETQNQFAIQKFIKID